MSKFISCTATSVQQGHKRVGFPLKPAAMFPDRHERPQIKAWRCDLTALSRTHNFYFVACNDAVHVYRPRFPDQAILGEPELILHPPTTSPYLEPGIDHEDSHSITRLHVDYLGQDEIILITCDDGDVIGYRTEEIQRVADKRWEASDDEDEFFIQEPVRTFLHRNVGASAWGLAIHQEARMIAISANTHQVTVIAYALAQLGEGSDSSSVSSDLEVAECSDEDPADFPSPRRQDHVITLSARHNVPSVSFINSGDDTVGRWLSSCSINGETLIWDLHHPEKCVRIIRLGFCASVKDPTKAPQHNPGTCACLRPSNFPHAVWSNMFLDASTAYEDKSLRDSALPPHHDHPLPYIQNVSACKGPFSVKDGTGYHQLPVPTQNLSTDEEVSAMDVSEDDSDLDDDSGSHSSSSSGSSSAEQSQRLDDEDNPVEPIVEEVSLSPQPATLADTNEASTGEGMSHEPTSYPTYPQIPSNAINAFGMWFQQSNGTATIVWDDDDSGSDDELFVPSTAQAQMVFANAIQPARAYCEVTTIFTLARQPHITSPLLIVTKEDVHLYQRPLDYAGDHLDPIVTIRRPLHPDKGENPYPFIPGSHDRHCYTTQIPELGVFIVASPNGRAGIFSLTKASQSSKSRPQYSFHLEYVLPFANDDKTKIWDVEGSRLIGVAAGPVQGMLDEPSEDSEDETSAAARIHKPASRRWRLMMYFTDHTVLGFELSKRRECGTPEVGELIV
ncbi:uncharacterized protein M421DRAFT_6616 [Didymella exigua CBS 183.55]|uniref:WD40 repeat-like protein n=1 Tax=Didymella exigua CBS 183.55 TaxID=1150837 RepID=A0A6A5RMD3_9PLEO|nr:uncharacterized protein M421DRAFT_6616 [Didymella exigua CBS 183.55]KAF1926697.1 hypothetical protein M421DRAFT_6616 [Didymella exigua CBS 183.55]